MEKLSILLFLGTISLAIALVGVYNVVTKRALGGRHPPRFIKGKDAVIIGWMQIILAVACIIVISLLALL